MNLTTLPSETVTKILGLARPIDIRRCQLVCRYLRNLVTSSSYLQYILELDACGYTVPLVSRQDLSYEDMIRALCDHRKAWEDPSSRDPEPIKLSLQNIVNPHFNGGILACGYAESEVQVGRTNPISEIHFHQLGSRNKGTGYKQWRLDDFGFPLEAFAFQPEIDLLVLIEGIVLAHDTTVEPFGSVRRSIKSYRVHFRTMSTNDPHWLAGSPVLDTGLSGVSGSTKSNDTQVIISLNGRMVMVRSDTMDAIIENTIIVWDWVEGIEKLRIIIPPNPTLQTCFSCLLSEEYLVVSRTVHDHHHSGVTVDKSSGPQALQKTSTIGQLDIYRLVSESNRARRAATFELPSLCTPYAYWHTTMGFGPAKIPWTPFWLARMKHTPCIYETDPRNRMLSLFTSIWITDPSDPQSESDPASSHSLLHVPVGTLLDYLEPDLYNHPAVIPWGDWGVKVPWINISSCSYPPSNLTSISGLRHSIRDLHYYLNLPQSSDQGERFYDRQGILDFDTQRVKFARASRRGHPYLASGKPSDEIFMTRLNTSGNLLFETPVNLTPSYEKVHINVDSRPTVSEFLSCIIDDEYIIINVKESQPDTKPHSRIYAYTL